MQYSQHLFSYSSSSSTKGELLQCTAPDIQCMSLFSVFFYTCQMFTGSNNHQLMEMSGLDKDHTFGVKQSDNSNGSLEYYAQSASVGFASNALIGMGCHSSSRRL